MTREQREHIRRMLDMVRRSQLGIGDDADLTGFGRPDVSADMVLRKEFEDYAPEQPVHSIEPGSWMPQCRISPRDHALRRGHARGYVGPWNRQFPRRGRYLWD